MGRFGAHISGGLRRVPEAAAELGAECVQVFVSAPQTWRPPSHPPEVVVAFREGLAELGIGPVVIHGIYLLNPASPDPELVERTVSSILDTLAWAERLGALGVVIHLGSSGQDPPEVGLERCATNLKAVLARAPGGARLLLETCAGQGNTIGRRFEELGYLVTQLADERVAVCVDSCHIFAAGYDITSAEGVAATLAALDRAVGLERVLAVHVNDSKAPLGSNRDRHENLGEGLIGEAGLRAFLQHPALAHLPLLLEVPGFSGNGPDRLNLERLRELAGAERGAEARLPAHVESNGRKA